MMSKIVRNYLKYARGGSKFSPWSILYPFQFVTMAWMRLRIGLYKRGIFSVTDPVLPVVSIGNISLGGTNKTPMTELVVRQFIKAGINAGLVSRGYKTKSVTPLWVGQDEDSLKREIAGDEPLMLAKRLPNVRIVVSKNRIKGVELLASLGVEVAVTDDTFQHKKMARDVDIVLVDSTCPFGNGNVLPAGLMREPMSSLKRADMVVLTKANQATKEERETEEKQAIIEEFAALGEEVIKSFEEKIGDYSVEELEKELSVIAFREGFSFNLLKQEEHIVTPRVDKSQDAAPAWIKAIEKKQKSE